MEGGKAGTLTCVSCNAVRGGLYEIEPEKLVVRRGGREGGRVGGWGRREQWREKYVLYGLLFFSHTL